MKALRRFVVRLATGVFGRRDERRMHEEIEQHLAFLTEENMRQGLPASEARRQAVLRFGPVEAVKEDYRDGQRLPLLEALTQDVRYALRQLRRAPVFAATAMLSLAAGIGTNAAVFTLVDRVMLRSLPVSEPELLVLVADQRVPQQPSPRFSYPFYARLKDNDVLSGITARFSLALNASLGDQVVRLSGELVSGSYFNVVGVGTRIGRPLSPHDDRTPGAHSVAVISTGFWQRGFGSDPEIVGRSLRINNHVFSIVGVTAAGFTGTELGLPVDVWLPLTMQREIGRDLLTETRTNWLEIIGRITPGMTLERGGDELFAYLERHSPAPAGDSRPAESHRLVLLPGDKGSSSARREIGPALRVLQALAALGLVLACINVASLLAVRTIAREKEIAVRLALGARRSSLVRQFLIETGVLAALGGAAGLLAAPWATGLLLAAPPAPLGIDHSLDLRLFLAGLAVCALTTVLIGLAPILASRKIGVGRLAATQPAMRPRTFRGLSLRDCLVTCQIAVSLVMLIAAALFVQSLRNLLAVDAGFQPANVLLITADPRAAGYNAGRIEEFWRAALARAGEVRGVHSVSLARIVPLAPGRQRQRLLNPATGESVEIDVNSVGPRYFRTLGASLLRGREFGDRDGKTSAPAVVVNERLAQVFWPNQDPLGKTIRVGGQNAPLGDVVGLVKDVKYRDLRDDASPTAYVPILQSSSSDPMTLHVRTAGDPGDLAGIIRRELQALDPNLPLFGIRTLEEQLNVFLAQPRQAARLSAGFAVLALLLSTIGVYGVTAFAISRQTREIGIRMALGADSGQIAGVVGRRGLALVVAGLALGMIGMFTFAQVIGALLFGVTATDWGTFAGMAALLTAVSFIAISVPASRATRLDAAAAIRCD